MIYAKVNKYILTLDHNILINIEDYTNNKNIDELLLFKKGNYYNMNPFFDTRDEAFYYKFFENYQMLFFENGYSGLHREYERGRIIKEFYHTNGIKNGLEKIYERDSDKTYHERMYIDNTLYEHKIFKNKKLIKTTKYNVNGQQYTETFYENGNISEKYSGIFGVLEGEYLKYYTNGKIEKCISYKNGKKNGIHKIYYPNGNIKLEERYLNDIRNGPYKTYTENNNLLISTIYLDGNINGIKTEYFENTNKICCECTYINGCLDGEYKQFYENGNMKLLCNYKYDKNYVSINKCEKNKHGEIIEFYENGNIHKRGTYVDNKLTGFYYIYDEKNNLVKQLRYNNNEFIE
jgi:antitoxin component YwqK of YwqJK toxin-antitoxin module